MVVASTTYVFSQSGVSKTSAIAPEKSVFPVFTILVETSNLIRLLMEEVRKEDVEQVLKTLPVLLEWQKQFS